MVITKVGKLKGTLVALCVFSILFTCFAGSMTVSAQSNTKLTASTISAERGSVVSVTVALNGNPGIWGVKLKVGYDQSALTLSSISNGNIFTDGDVTLPQTLTKQPFVYYACSNELKNIKTNGTLVTLKFKVSKTAAFSKYPITVSLAQAINIAGKNVSMDTQNGNVTVVKCVHNKVWSTTKAAGCETGGTEKEICSKCREVFSTRKLKATGHKNTAVKNKVAATNNAEGYTGDTYCKDCGELLSKGKVIKKLSDKTVNPNGNANNPAIIQGKKAVFDKSSKQNLVFVSNADFSTFVRVEVDGATLDKNNYSVESGSTVVTIFSEYLNTLADGEYTAGIVSKGGTATTQFTVQSEQKAGDSSTTSEITKSDTTNTPTNTTPNTSNNTILFIIVLIVLLCAGGLVAFINIKKRRK